jgi:hypothetical protein
LFPNSELKCSSLNLLRLKWNPSQCTQNATLLTHTKSQSHLFIVKIIPLIVSHYTLCTTTTHCKWLGLCLSHIRSSLNNMSVRHRLCLRTQVININSKVWKRTATHLASHHRHRRQRLPKTCDCIPATVVAESRANSLNPVHQTYQVVIHLESLQLAPEPNSTLSIQCPSASETPVTNNLKIEEPVPYTENHKMDLVPQTTCHPKPKTH